MIKEKRLEKPTLKYFNDLGFKCNTEVKILERRVDIIGIKKSEIVSIELKVSNWKQAFKQAIICKLWSNYVYIVLWHKYKPKQLDLFSQMGIGLIIIIAGKAECIIEALPSDNIHRNLLIKVKNEMNNKT